MFSPLCRAYGYNTEVSVSVWRCPLLSTHAYVYIDRGIPVANRPHDDVIKWKHLPRYWPFVREIHRSQVNSPHKGQWRGAVFDLRLNKRLSKQSWGWWFETLPRPLWRHSNGPSQVQTYSSSEERSEMNVKKKSNIFSIDHRCWWRRFNFVLEST